MTVSDDITAALARNDLNDDQKKVEVQRIKGVAWRDNLAAVVGNQFRLGIYTVTLTALPQFQNNFVYIWCNVTKNGLPVPLDLPVMIRNPPILSATGREDIRNVAIEILTSLAGP